jgi:DNA invertase Pin-like site-specific DNA recombinase
MTGRPRKYDIKREDLIRLREAGYGRTLIAKVYGCDQATIRHWLIKYDLPTIAPRIRPAWRIMNQLMSAAE